MGDGTEQPRLLVVDDEPEIVDLYEVALGGDYEVRAAHGGPEALGLVEEDGDFDVALVDRRMPGASGDEVLARLKQTSPDCRVAMVTAVEPDFDVIDMPFDEYLVKPISRSDIRETVARLLRLKSYQEQCREEYAIVSKVAALRAHKEPEELAGREEYHALVARLEELRETLNETTDRFTTAEFAAAFAEIGGREPQTSRSD